MKDRHLHMLRHALGLTGKGLGKRNYIITYPNEADGLVCQELVKLGMMEDRGDPGIKRGCHLYLVTGAGREAVHKASMNGACRS